jgi:hypothetical protein
MLLYSIIGSILGFCGSIIFAAALIKPPQQVRDETATYFDENPFTTRYEMEARRNYVLAFSLLTTGFAFGLAGQISEKFFNSSGTIALLFAISLSLLGYLGAALLLLFKLKKHEAFRVELKRKSFSSQVESHRHELRQEQFKKNDFAQIKKQFAQSLKERYDRLPDYDRERERLHFSDINSSNNWDDMLEASERYLAGN